MLIIPCALPAIITGADGEDAVERVCVQRLKYDVILIDENMVRLNGSAATVAIRRCARSLPSHNTHRTSARRTLSGAKAHLPLHRRRSSRRFEREGGVAPHARVPVIAVTANALPEDRLRFCESGMDGIVAKPVKISALLGDVKAFLEARAAPGHLSLACVRRCFSALLRADAPEGC